MTLEIGTFMHIIAVCAAAIIFRTKLLRSFGAPPLNNTCSSIQEIKGLMKELARRKSSFHAKFQIRCSHVIR